MKKFSIASVALCALLAVSSCGTDNALTFIPVTYNETSALEEGAQDSIKISMEWNIRKIPATSAPKMSVPHVFP